MRQIIVNKARLYQTFMVLHFQTMQDRESELRRAFLCAIMREMRLQEFDHRLHACNIADLNVRCI